MCIRDSVNLKGSLPHCLQFTGALTALTSGSVGYYRFNTVLNTPEKVQALLTTFQWKGQHILLASCCSNKFGLVSNHAYSILGTTFLASMVDGEAKLGETLVILRNPWGRKTWTGRLGNIDWKGWEGENTRQHARFQGVDWAKVKSTRQDPFDDGIFYMPVGEFHAHFRAVVACEIPFKRIYRSAI
eukprot:TRINITY_DN8098_c0_g2_i1.p1 TRINITY_DN8098_c0_g2~~TRINITY_DN8098_c0_g2_i1.p1  ORF type:complete len:186 (+),score=22.12 TRINITY_DN8098_c0_g2_i1:118-675(+)